MAIYKGEDTPYAKTQKTADISERITMPELTVNRSLEEIITLYAKALDLMERISQTARAYYMDDKTKVLWIKDATKEYTEQ